MRASFPVEAGSMHRKKQEDDTIAVRHKWWGSEGSLVLGKELPYQNAVIVLNNGHYFLARTHQAPSSC